MPAQAHPVSVEYVLPLRWDGDEDLTELTGYLHRLCRVLDVTVVDGSADDRFAVHAAAWQPHIRHIRPAPWPGRNRKVAGVVTGVVTARHELVVVADDDVRYTETQLLQVVAPLVDGVADVVRPQNVFSPLPWHARWDTARTVLNRAFAADYPGTFAFRRSVFLRMGGYDGDVLFENLQMLRTFRAAGAMEYRAGDVYVLRRPPTTAKFLVQRVRQAYDDFAQPGRLVVEAAWLPTICWAALRRPALLPLFAGGAVAVAEKGRRRHNGATVFAATSALWAPAWVLERAVCVWLAVGSRVRGGVRYRGTRLRNATTAVRERPPIDLSTSHQQPARAS